MNSHLKDIAHHISNHVGGSPKARRYYTDDRLSWIDIFSAVDQPERDLVTYATIGLSQYSIQRYFPNHKELRVELIGVAGSGQELFANALASCAFNVVLGTHTCSPGAVYPNVISQYDATLTMKHMLFVPMFLWDIEDLEFDHGRVTWLMAIPISDKELKVVQQHGAEHLEALFEEQQVAYWDLNRPEIRF